MENIPIIKDFNTFFLSLNFNIELAKIKTHHWYPIKNIIDILVVFCENKKMKNILEIGPGKIPFPLANKFIGYNEKIKDYIEIDIDTTALPFEYKELEFIYSRHTLEDIQNPDFAMKEIIRTSKSGYIETPSPLIEILKGIDYNKNSDLYGGYIHHRYIIWSNIEKCEIYILPKYSNIIDNFLVINEKELKKLYCIANNYPIYWNNYFFWFEREPKIIVYKNGINMGVNRDLIEDYSLLIGDAINQSLFNTNYMIQKNPFI
jgi:hypothetical protein